MAPKETDLPAGELDAILELVARSAGLDVRDYKRSTLARRVEARMTALGLNAARAYRLRLEEDGREIEHLAAELLVQVTSFFRDPPVFRALEESVLPTLAPRTGSDVLRAWVVGTATGEEAYTLAMILAGACERAGSSYEVLATDRSARALEVARRGCYEEADLALVPAPLRERFFRREGATWRVAEPLRDRVRFVEHDLMAPRLAPREAVIATFDLVVCRNVLIYFDARYQEGAFERLATVVRQGGALVLGAAESLRANVHDRFVSFPGLEGGLRIYRREPASTPSG